MTQRPSAPEDLRLWTAVDRYYEKLLTPRDPVLESALAGSRAAGLPDIQVSPLQGKLLYLLAKLGNVRRILEIGTLGGYSTIWLARALPSEGHLITLELEPKHAQIAEANVTRAGLAHLVEIQVGPALRSLAKLVEHGEAPFDLIFIDADKPSYSGYLELALKLSRRGTLIVLDNVVRRGDVVDDASSDLNVQGIRELNERLHRFGNLESTVIQTVGVKGHDGFALVVVG